MKLDAHRFTTSLGDMLAAVDESGALVHLDFCADSGTVPGAATSTLPVPDRWPGTSLHDEVVWDAARCAHVERQMTEYCRGERRAFDLALAPNGTPFQQCVWQALTTIPYGATTSYGELAARLGQPGAARAVGRANATNPIAVVVPCHRVIGTSGALTGYASGVELKERLLALEGAELRRSHPARRAGVQVATLPMWS